MVLRSIEPLLIFQRKRLIFLRQDPEIYYSHRCSQRAFMPERERVKVTGLGLRHTDKRYLPSNEWAPPHTSCAHNLRCIEVCSEGQRRTPNPRTRTHMCVLRVLAVLTDATCDQVPPCSGNPWGTRKVQPPPLAHTLVPAGRYSAMRSHFTPHAARLVGARSDSRLSPALSAC